MIASILLLNIADKLASRLFSRGRPNLPSSTDNYDANAMKKTYFEAETLHDENDSDFDLLPFESSSEIRIRIPFEMSSFPNENIK